MAYEDDVKEYTADVVPGQDLRTLKGKHLRRVRRFGRDTLESLRSTLTNLEHGGMKWQSYTSNSGDLGRLSLYGGVAVD